MKFKIKKLLLTILIYWILCCCYIIFQEMPIGFWIIIGILTAHELSDLILPEVIK